MKATLAQLLAAAQLAEMLYQADQVEHKREAWEKAEREYNEAAEAEHIIVFSPAGQPGTVIKDLALDPKASEPYKELENHNQLLTVTVDALNNENAVLHNEKLVLAEENGRLKESNSLLNSQLIEKSQKIDELEKSALSAKPTVPATAETTAPAATPESTPAATDAPLTAYQKGLLTRAANLAAKAEGEPKKNS